MQFLPSSPLSLFEHAPATDIFSRAPSPAESPAPEGEPAFDQVLSSFIEEGRTDYTGLPPGFSAHAPQNGTITQQELDEIKSALEKNKANGESLDALDRLLASGGTVTIGTILSTLTGNKRGSAELTDDERMLFRAMMTRAGASENEINDMLATSDKGKGKDVWNAFAAKMSGLDGQTFSFTKEEMRALLKGMDISDDARTTIMGKFGNNPDVQLSKDDMNSFFGAAREELQRKEALTAHMEKVARGAIAEALDTARLRGKSEPVADIRGSQGTAQLEALMQENILKKNGLKNLYELEKENIAGEEAPPAFSPELANIRKTFGAEGETGFAPRRETRDQAFGTLSANTGTKEKNAVSELLATVSANIPETPSVQIPQPDKVNLENLARAHRQEIFDQVQNGFLQSAQNGASRITLQLDPKDLGQISLILSVHEGEVRATIRAERPESAAALAEQLAELKNTLEEQGLKVAELEVRTGLQEFSNQTWTNAQEHNSMQESLHRGRMQRLAKIQGNAPSKMEEHRLAPRAMAEEHGFYTVA